MKFVKRTEKCGLLNSSKIGNEVVLNGWVASNRNLGGLLFIDLRDRWGIAQLVIEPENFPQLAELGRTLRSEFVIWAKGVVKKRKCKH